jgi:hypothetical protein
MIFFKTVKLKLGSHTCKKVDENKVTFKILQLSTLIFTINKSIIEYYTKFQSLKVGLGKKNTINGLILSCQILQLIISYSNKLTPIIILISCTVQLYRLNY